MQTTKSLQKLPLPVLLFSLVIFTSLINFTIQLSTCAIVFTLISININLIAGSHGFRNATYSLLIAILCATLVVYEQNFYVQGTKIAMLATWSLFSITFSNFIGILLSHQYKNLNYAAKNFISLSVAGFLDSLIMLCVLGTALSSGKLLNIFILDFSYKLIFCAAVSGVIMLAGICKTNKVLG